MSALVKSEEFIMETFSNHDKVKFLIYDLICTEIWKQKVLPLIKNTITKQNPYRSYLAVYHEAVVCNILEIILFSRTAVESAENYLIDLIDYGYRKLVSLSKLFNKKAQPVEEIEDILKRTRIEEFES